MSAAHQFIFTPTVWLGEGALQFTASQEKLRFFTRWVFDADKGGVITALQKVEISEAGQAVRNSFRFFDFDAGSFQVELRNELIGQALGKGVFDSRRLAWEFRCPEIGFEGYEVYELETEQKRYKHKAEYASPDQLRTTVNGHVWLKAEQGE